MAVNTTNLAELLEQLVNIPSVTGNEQEIADWITKRLAAQSRGEVIRHGLSVVWRAPRKGRPLIVLAGHTDTVPPQGNATARRVGDQLFGVGTTDMKAGDAVMLALAESLDLDAMPYDLACVFYDAEEGPAEKNGLTKVLQDSPWLREASLAIILEPTDLAVEMGCNGILNCEVRVPGVAAHAARPWQGKNAVAEGAEWLVAITKHPVIGHAIQGLEFRETLQVTTLRAGTTRNVVPAEMVVNLNHRFPPDRTTEQAITALKKMIPPAFQFEVVDQAAPGKVCLDDAIVQRFVKQTRARVGGKQGWTDVARFTAAGIPAFNYGPGIPDLCHRADEYCPIPNLGEIHDQLATFLSRESA
ncbi:MAG: succinyl-diaminopimelate desuccinylase [Candidatus Eisenbacteria bacterium]|nr:succinyl-diaminopimelate desuccinylase [Candidatus Eisenbacteria bacterium]